MKTIKEKISGLIISLALINGFIYNTSCSEEKKEVQVENLKIEKPDLKTFFDKIPEQTLPYKDTLLWETPDSAQIPQNIEMALGLSEHLGKKRNVTGDNLKYFWRYKLNLHKHLVGTVICVEHGAERTNYLFLFDEAFKIREKFDVSYDEIAEGAFYSWSMVYNDSIVNHDFNYFESSETVSKYTIEKDGHFKKLSEEKIIVERQICDNQNGISEESIGIIICPRKLVIYDDSLLQKQYLFWDLTKDFYPNKPACATFYKPDYGVVHYECLFACDDYYKIRINFNEVKYLPNERDYRFDTWEEYIGESLGGINPTGKSVDLFEKPDWTSASTKILSYNLCPLEMKGDWLKVQIHCYQNPHEDPKLGASCITYTADCADNKTGWIKWREGNKLLIEIHKLL